MNNHTFNNCVFKIFNLFKQDFSCLLKPIANCCNYLNRDLMISLFEEPFFRIYEIIKKIEGEEFKDKVS